MKIFSSTITGFIMLSLCSGTMAQSSTAARAERLAKLEEDLNSPDPNLRLAALEEAMQAKSAAMRTKAKSIALTSSDINLQSLALRYALCQSNQLTIQTYVVEYRNVYGRVQSRPPAGMGGSVFTIQTVDCDVLSGKFTVPAKYDFRKPGSGYVSGTSLTINFRVDSGGGSSECIYQGSLEKTDLIGILNCVEPGDGDVYKADGATIRL